MAFNKITYSPGDVLTSEQMNNIQDAIKTNEGNINPHIINTNNPHKVTIEQLLAAGYMVLSPKQCGTDFPTDAPDGTLFFKEVE